MNNLDDVLSAIALLVVIVFIGVLIEGITILTDCDKYKQSTVMFIPITCERKE